MQNIHPYFLRTNSDPDGKGYATLEEARLAMDNLISRRSEVASRVTSQIPGFANLASRPGKISP
jgi:hypothetical protein